MTAPMAWPPADVMYARNEELLAERLRWPAGVLKEVRLLRAAHPGWKITWSRGGVSAWREDGYYAWPATYTWPGRRFVHRANPLELSVVLDLAPMPTPSWTPPGGWLPLTDQGQRSGDQGARPSHSCA